MILKSLEIQGFKSFPDRTKITVESGITAVVGPNGSGKSNISDAIRWVMGETSAKQLRGGSKMEDVIFNGSQNRNAMGYASAVLTLDNSEGRLDIEAEEVAIGRKAYRSGDSEYTINGKQVRLKDIYELFLDTGLGKHGYSMIGQGRIAEIVGAKSAERREIFEEASGIAKYRYRKKEAEKQLASTADNLVRLNDILSELSSRVEPLKRESQKAEKFLVLAQERKKCEITLFLSTVETCKEQLREAAKKLEIVTADYNQNSAEIEKIERETEAIRRKANDLLVQTDEKNAAIRRAQESIAQGDSRVAVLNNDNVHHLARRDLLTAELTGDSEKEESDKQKRAQLEEELEKQREGYALIEGEISSLKHELEALAQKALQAGESKKGDGYKLSTLETETVELRLALAAAKTEQETLTQRITEGKQQLENHLSRKEEAEGKYRSLRRAKEDTDDSAQRLQNMANGLSMKLKTRDEAVKKAEFDRQELGARLEKTKNRLSVLEDMQKNNEGFAGSVRAILTAGQNGRLSGICGAVSALFRVEKGYETAIETALGGAAQNIVVENERSAKAGIRMLKDERIGRATFLPLDTVRPSSIRDRLPEGARTADTYVTTDARYGDVLSNLLGRIVVAEDLNEAGEFAKHLSYRYRIVTMDGQVINAGGSFTGGSVAKGVGAFSRRTEIEKLHAEAEKLEKELDKLSEISLERREELAEITAELQATEAEQRTAFEDCVRAKTELEAAKQLLDTLFEATEAAEAAGELQARRSGELKAQIERLTTEISTKESACEQLRIALAEQEDDDSQQVIEMSDRREKISEKQLTALALQKDIEQSQSTLELLREQESQGEQQRRNYSEQVAELERTMTHNEEEIKRHSQEAARSRELIIDLENDLHEISQTRLEGEGELTKFSAKMKEFYGRSEELSKERTRITEKEYALQTEYDDTITKLWEEYELGLTDAMDHAIEYESLAALKRRVAELRGSIKALGNVNVAAIEEYAEVSVRHDFMQKQVSDITEARDGLLQLISELSGEMRSIFTRSFETINGHFLSIFKALFGGGSAQLTLSDPEDVLESGIDITVSPPGKIIKNLQSLSGGEQSLVAIAIYFAILAVNPAPFCVLDEIDAALDDVNVMRFADYLRKITQNTQFVVITHRRGTMEEADVLYGVTMQEDGVSRMLKLDTKDGTANISL